MSDPDSSTLDSELGDAIQPEPLTPRANESTSIPKNEPTMIEADKDESKISDAGVNIPRSPIVTCTETVESGGSSDSGDSEPDSPNNTGLDEEPKVVRQVILPL